MHKLKILFYVYNTLTLLNSFSLANADVSGFNDEGSSSQSNPMLNENIIYRDEDDDPTNLPHKICGDWYSYKNEKCFKVYPSLFLTFEEANRFCKKRSNNSYLLQILSQEEQQYFNEFMDELQLLDDIWLGFTVDNSSTNGSLVFKRWDDSLEEFIQLSYYNWNSIKSVGPQIQTSCVQLQSNIENGTWIIENCRKKATVVCQRDVAWNTDKITFEILSGKKTNKELTQRLENALEDNKKIHDLTSKMIKELKQRLDTVLQDVLENKKMRNVTSKLQKKQEEIASKQAADTLRIDNMIPKGFIYVQFPKQLEASKIWPAFQWKEITSEYSGHFFRAAGNGASDFGTSQVENAPRVTGMKSQLFKTTSYAEEKKAANVPVGKDSDWIWSGDDVPGMPTYGLIRVALTTSSGEVRPKNYAIKIWKRA